MRNRKLSLLILLICFVTILSSCTSYKESNQGLKETTDLFNDIPARKASSPSNISTEHKGLRVELYENQDGVVYGFQIQGTTNYAEYGKDIVAAGVSVLVQNTVTSIQTLTTDKIEATVEEGNVRCSLLDMKQGRGSSEASVLLKSMVIGLISIQNSYGSEYIMLERVLD
jgi:uncharacterized protein YsxB (DUF464 family)